MPAIIGGMNGLGFDYDYYLSGPMTGIPEHNFPVFHEAAERLRILGFKVLNPAELGVVEGWDWADYLRRDLPYVCRSQRVAVLRGWQQSRGARLEVHIARALELAIDDADTLESWGTPPAQWQGQVIGLWGVARAGKDTLCEVLGWPRAAFADELKADLDVFVRNHVTDEISQGMDAARIKEILRPLYVAGGAQGRALKDSVWIDRLFLPPGMVCITDVRYLNECKWVWDKGGIVFEVLRPGFEPANDEERRSFNEIRAYLEANPHLNVPRIFNDWQGSPQQMAAQARYYIENHFRRRAA